MKTYLTVIILALAVSFGYAQKPEKGQYKRLSLDIYGGLPIFFGDIKSQFKSYNASVRVNYGLTSALSLGGEFSYGSIKGQDTDTDGDYFATNYLKAMIGSEVYMLNILKFTELGSKFQPFMGVHVGAVQGKVTSAGSNEGEDLEYFKGVSFAHQWHTGAKFKLSKTFDLNLRATILAMKTDDFDNQNAAVEANRSSDAIFNVELGVTVHIGGKGKNPIVWFDPNMVSEESLITDTVLPVEFSLDEKLNLINTKRMQNEAKTSVEIAALKMEKDDLKSQLSVLEQKVDALTKANAAPPVQKPETNKNSNSNSGGNFLPTEEELYVANLIGPLNANFYIVSGSFAQIENAEQRINALNKKGYTPIIMREPSSNNLNRVIIDSASSYKKALQLLIKYKKEVDSTAWIIKQER